MEYQCLINIKYNNRKTLQKFLNSENDLYLFFTRSLIKDDLQVSLMPSPSSKKGVVIIKRQSTKVNAEDIEENLYYEEISPNSLKFTSLLLEELYLPLIKNNQNQKNWSKVVSHDIIGQFNRFSGILDMFIGQTAGSTILPIPPIEELAFDKTENDRALVHILESAIIDWTREIKVSNLNDQ